MCVEAHLGDNSFNRRQNPTRQLGKQAFQKAAGTRTAHNRCACATPDPRATKEATGRPNGHRQTQGTNTDSTIYASIMNGLTGRYQHHTRT